jgi:hypothetical protein
LALQSHSRQIALLVSNILDSRSPAGDVTPPSTPGTPTVTAISASQLNLSWAASTDSSGILNYTIERSAHSANTWAAVGIALTNSYQDTGLSASTQYDYRIKATDAAQISNDSAYSGTGTGTTLASGGGDSDIPTSPVLNATPVVVNSTTIRVTIDTPSTDSSGILGYMWLYSTSSGGTFIVHSSLTNSLTYDFTGLSPNTTYFFKVRGVDNSGSSKLGTPSNIVSATTGSVGTVYYRGGFDVTATITSNSTVTDALGNQYRGSINSSSSGNCKVTFQSAIKLFGAFAQKSEVHYTNASDYRAEVEHLTAPRPALSGTPTRLAYRIPVMCPDDASFNDPIDCAFFQLHQTAWVATQLRIAQPAGYTEPQVIFIILDQSSFKRTYILGSKATLLPRGTWVQWTLVEDFSTAANGGFELYRNGVLLASATNIVTLETSLHNGIASAPPYPKTGCYKYPWKYTGGITITFQIIYHDDLVIGDSYNAVQA